MRKIFEYEKYKFSLYDITTSIIYNDEKLKNEIINNLKLDDACLINSKIIYSDILVRDFLKYEKFDMKLVPYFNLQTILSKNLNSLKMSDQMFLKIIIIITSKDQLVIFDDVLSFLSEEKKKKIFMYLKENKIKYINFTSDVEEVLFTNYLIVLSKSGVALEGKLKSVLNEEKILKRLGFSLPVIFDLSLQLKAYGVIDEVCFDVDKLVKKLWNQ